MIGVTCDPGLAVARGVWRKLRTGRSVRSATLLRSHRLFSEHYERTAHLVDVATLYHTGQHHVRTARVPLVVRQHHKRTLPTW